jgi:hypothetical protein
MIVQGLDQIQCCDEAPSRCISVASGDVGHHRSRRYAGIRDTRAEIKKPMGIISGPGLVEPIPQPNHCDYRRHADRVGFI